MEQKSMIRVVGVRFKRAGKMYFFDPDALELHMGDEVVVETARGLDIGEVVLPPGGMEEERVVAPLKKVIRMATQVDLQNAAQNAENEKRAFEVCLEKIAAHRLEMKLVDVEYTFDGSKIVFYFTANGRVDFRALVKDLASVFKTRIELRQIGVRDEAKMLGGLGPCGRQICCGAFLGDFQPVSIKMAKEQGLSLNPTKISGLCGRLMCCLKYEQDVYEQVRKRLPRPGKSVQTPDGVGMVLEINVLKETVRVRISNGDSFEVKEYPAQDCSKLGAESRQERPQEAAQENQEPEAPRERSERSGGRPERPRRDRQSPGPNQGEFQSRQNARPAQEPPQEAQEGPQEASRPPREGPVEREDVYAQDQGEDE